MGSSPASAEKGNAAALSRHPRQRVEAVSRNFEAVSVLFASPQATDTTAMTLAMDNQMPIIVFELKDPQNILRVVQGDKIGTIIKED